MLRRVAHRHESRRLHDGIDPADPSTGSSSMINHGERGGGAADNAFNYQGFVADVTDLPISERTEMNIEARDSD